MKGFMKKFGTTMLALLFAVVVVPCAVLFAGCKKSENESAVGVYSPESITIGESTINVKDLSTLDESSPMYYYSFFALMTLELKSDGTAVAKMGGEVSEGTMTWTQSGSKVTITTTIEEETETQECEYKDGKLIMSEPEDETTSANVKLTYVKVSK